MHSLKWCIALLTCGAGQGGAGFLSQILSRDVLSASIVGNVG